MKKIKNKNIIIVALIMTLAISVTGSTYAYFALSATATNKVTGTAATASLDVVVSQATLKSTNTGVFVPQKIAGLGTAMNTTNQCVDGNGNIVCKVYTITVTNNSNAAAIVRGSIKFNSFTTNLKWRRVKSTTALDTVTTGSYADTGVASSGSKVDLTTGKDCPNTGASANCTDVSLTAKGGATPSATYYIVVWINETGAEQQTADAGKSFEAIVSFEGRDGTGITSTITG